MEDITDKIENLLGDLIDKKVNEAYNNNKFQGEIENQNKYSQGIFDEVIKSRE